LAVFWIFIKTRENLSGGGGKKKKGPVFKKLAAGGTKRGDLVIITR
jgi:hypothetical protein